MANDKNKGIGKLETTDPVNDKWVGIEEASRILGMNVEKGKYNSETIRRGFLKGKIAYKSISGRNYQFSLKDLRRVAEQATVPATRL